jgi:aminoglycoside phosphotransferase (APT) family kinase protein
MSEGHSCRVEVDGDVVRRWARTDGGTFPVYDLELQTRVINAISVPSPRPATYADGVMTMPFVDGKIPHDFTPIDKWLKSLPSDAERRRVWESTIDTIAAIHREPLVEGLRVGLSAELAYWGDYMLWIGMTPPQLREVYDWCVAHAPLSTEPEPVLLWGDVRYGNIVYDDATLSPKAVLDWDMVSAGPPEMDIAWLTALEAVGLEMTQMSVAGFGSRDETIARFEGHLGRSLRDFDWYEIFALLRASAISTRIALLDEAAGKASMFKVGEDPTLALAQRRIAGL